ncbi:MAG: DUF1428 domain-containing protein [Gammaproteobacteria bacterium]|nr:DUF1428 domain-containing protein [Gammaproteobacteria bacterium]
MAYIDGFVLAVPTANKAEYLALAEAIAEIYKDLGALEVVESWGNDIPDGEVTSFPMAVKCEPNETVVFSWVTWESREARDRGNELFMQDERLKCMSEEMPFDGKRMILGGFETILQR